DVPAVIVRIDLIDHLPPLRSAGYRGDRHGARFSCLRVHENPAVEIAIRPIAFGIDGGVRRVRLDQRPGPDEARDAGPLADEPGADRSGPGCAEAGAGMAL